MLLLATAFYFLSPVTPDVNKIAKSVNSGNTNKVMKTEAVAFVRQGKVLKRALLAFTTKQRTKKSHGGLGLNKVIRIPAESIGYVNSPKNDIYALMLNPALLSPAKTFVDSISPLSADVLVEVSPKEGIDSVARNKKVVKRIQGFAPKFALSVFVAPDINGVNKIANGGQTGSNFGLQFSMQLSRKLSISSGAFYAVKPYQTNTGNYTPSTQGWWKTKFGTTGKPDNVAANCEVLDIPLNINYQLFRKAGNSLSVGSGLSSYFMLRETYHFTFDDPSINSTKFEINNRNQHLLGVVNLNATYERKVNSRIGLLIQPYLKLPVSKIGFGQVDLQSAGVAVGLSWDINSFRIK